MHNWCQYICLLSMTASLRLLLLPLLEKLVLLRCMAALQRGVLLPGAAVRMRALMQRKLLTGRCASSLTLLISYRSRLMSTIASNLPV